MVSSDSLEHLCILKACLHASRHNFAVIDKTVCKFPMDANIFSCWLDSSSTSFWCHQMAGALLRTRSLPACISKKTMQLYSALTVLFSAEPSICAVDLIPRKSLVGGGA